MSDKKWSEPKGKQKFTYDENDTDIVASDELKLFIENDAEIYRQRIQPIQKNLARKKWNGVYDSKKAEKGFMYAVDDGAKKYTKNFGGSGNGSFGVFSPRERRYVAEKMAREFEADFDNGEFDEYKQKKFQKEKK